MGDVRPKVAMLSYSTIGAPPALAPPPRKVEAAAFAKEKAPRLADGDLRLDAAIVLRRPAQGPSPELCSHANVLVFPTSETSNIGCKLVSSTQRGAGAYGPILRGIASR